MLHLPALRSAALPVLLLCGAALTFKGFSDLTSSPTGAADWRWSFDYLVIFCFLAAMAAVAGLFRGPIIGGTVMIVILTLALGAAVPLAVVLLLGLSSFTLGQLVLRDQRIEMSDSLLVGAVVFGTLLSLLVHLDVNTSGTWVFLFGLPVLLGWRHVHLKLPLRSVAAEFGVHSYILYCALSAAVMLHILAALMPETGHDALAIHLFVPAHVAYHQRWDFDVGTYAWAVMPMLVDWLYSAGYMFAGETGARLVNVGAVLLLANQVFRLSQWAGAGETPAGWAALLFLLTPLTYTETSSLFIEGMWSALLVGGMFSLLRLLTREGKPQTQLWLGSLLLGGAIAAKAIAFVLVSILALLMLATTRRWVSTKLLPALAGSLVIFILVAGIPYLTAYVVTGNPVFPFFNGYFQSQYFPPENFRPPDIFNRGVTWDILYQMTFNSPKFLEGTIGSAGFQWLLLVFPALVSLLLATHKRITLLVLVSVLWMYLTFSQTAYLRYVFPTFAISSVIAAHLLSVAQAQNRWLTGCVAIALISAVVLNMVHFSSGTFNSNISIGAVIDEKAKRAYLRTQAPMRSIVQAVDALNENETPVAFFSQPLAAGLKADALYANWYNPDFSSQVEAAEDAEGLAKVLASRNVDYIIADSAELPEALSESLNDISTEITQLAPLSLRRLNDRYRFAEELLPSTNFLSGWSLVEGAERLSVGVKVTVSSPALITVPVQPNTTYRYEATVECGAVEGALGRLQVNWLDSNDALLKASIEVFECTPTEQIRVLELHAPPEASRAVVYASSHTEHPIIFKKLSFRE